MTDRHDIHRRPGPRIAVLVAVGAIAVCLVVVIAIAVLRSGQDEPAPVAQPDVPAPESTEQTAPATRTIQEEAEAVAGLIMTSSGGWAAHITDLEVTTVLRRPVIVVSTDIGPEQAGLSEEFASALTSFSGGLTVDDGTPYTYYLQIRSSEGDVIGAVGAADERWDLETPPTPADPATLRSWLDMVYGSGASHPEAWLTRVSDIADRVDTDGNIVVRTDLDPDSPDDQRAAQTIIDAVNSSGATFAPGIRVVFGDGAFEWSALLDGVDPYGP